MAGRVTLGSKRVAQGVMVSSFGGLEHAQKTRTSGGFQLAKVSKFEDLMLRADLRSAATSNGGGLHVLSV